MDKGTSPMVNAFHSLTIEWGRAAMGRKPPSGFRVLENRFDACCNVGFLNLMRWSWTYIMSSAYYFTSRRCATMQVYIVYGIAFWCSFGAFAVVQAYRILQHHAGRFLGPLLRKWFLYATAFPRRSGSSDCTILGALILIAYVVGNAYSASVGNPSREELIKRLGKLCLINMVPLFLGGRTSYLVDKGLSISLSHYHFMHRWVGRVCLAHGLAHGALRAVENIRGISGIEIAVSKPCSNQTRPYI